MPRPSSPAPALAPPWLHLLREHLLARLDAEAQLRLDARTRLQVELWLTAAGERGWLTADPCSAQGGLRAIVCKTAREQAQFDEVFARWVTAPDVGAGAAPGGRVLQRPGEGGGPGESTGHAAQGWWARLWRLGTSRPWLAVFALLVLGLAFYMLGGGTSEPAAPAPQAAASSTFGTPTGPVLNVPMAMEVDRAAFIDLTKLPAPATPSQPSDRWLFGIHPAIYAVLLLIAASAMYGVQRTGQQFVGRIATRENLREQEVFARHLLPVSGARRHALRRAARALRKPRVVEGRSLDLLASVRASAQRAGLFQPVYRARQATPDYLVLVDRARPGDQQAHWAAEIARDLAAEGVSLTLYEFDRDPRWLALLRTHRSAAAASVQRFLPLAGVAASHHGQGLIMLGDGDGLVDARSGRLHAWVNTALAPWPRRVLLTPRPMCNWGSAEDQLAGAGQAAHEPSFLVLPAQIDSLGAATHWLRDGRLTAIEALPGAPQHLPPSLLDDPGRWLSREAPEAQELVQLIEQLRAGLGPVAYTWLAASAAYPHLSADLTAFLAHRLGDGEPAAAGAREPPADSAPGNDPRLLEARLIAIGQLPWCRHGLMPDWLRRALILSLPLSTRQRVRAVWTSLFDQAGQRVDELGPDAATSLGRIATPVDASARPDPHWLQDLRRRIGLARAVQAEPADSPLRDVIYLGMLRGDLDAELSLQAPEEFARAAADDLGPRLTWNPLRWLAAAVLLSWLVARIWPGALVRRARQGRDRRPSGADGAEETPAVKPEQGAAAQETPQRADADVPGGEPGRTIERPAPMVFLNVQRAEAVPEARELRAGLTRQFGPSSVFMNSAEASWGSLRAALDISTVMVAVISPGWLGQTDTGQFDVLQSALLTGMPVIPVLVQGARMPQAEDLPVDLRDLVRHAAIDFRLTSMERDLLRVMAAIDRLTQHGSRRAT